VRSGTVKQLTTVRRAASLPRIAGDWGW
jgi:hypothetical protein